MTATERLRELLDELGVEWDGESYEGVTFWNEETNLAVASDDRDGKLWMSMLVTPEHAIAATVGNDGVGRSKNGVERSKDGVAETCAFDDYTAKLMAELVQVMEERDTLSAKFEVSQSMRHAQYEQYTKESAELRELVKDMFNCIRYANEQDWFYFERDKCGCGVSCVVNGEECGLTVLADRMRKLGIEVAE